MPGRISSRAAGFGVPLAAVAILAAACGGATPQAANTVSTPGTSVAPPPPSQSSTAPATTSTSAPGPTTTLSTESGGYGVWLTDRTGRTLYILTSDRGTTSSFYGACATTWPPLLTTGPLAASGGAMSADLGTASRTDGTTQVTYAGHPLYFFARETGPDQVKGLGAQGTFFLVSPSGSVIKPPPPPPPMMAPPPMMTKPRMTPPRMAPPPMTMKPMMGG